MHTVHIYIYIARFVAHVITAPLSAPFTKGVGISANVCRRVLKFVGVYGGTKPPYPEWRSGHSRNGSHAWRHQDASLHTWRILHAVLDLGRNRRPKGIYSDLRNVSRLGRHSYAWPATCPVRMHWCNWSWGFTDRSGRAACVSRRRLLASSFPRLHRFIEPQLQCHQ